MAHKTALIFLSLFLWVPLACTVATAPYHITKGSIEAGVWIVKKTYQAAAGGTKVVYRLGEFTYEVVSAPLHWPLTHEEVETVDGLPVREAIRLGRVKNSPYTVNGRTYYPVSLDEAETYSETGIASWYGYETRNKRGGHMTANGEAFQPTGLTAAHKHLPLPMYARVTNLENGRSIIVRVNDRGPFPTHHNPKSGDRIIDLSLGAARKLGFYRKGTARVAVKTIPVREE